MLNSESKGTIATNEEATIDIKDLDTLVRVQLVDDFPAVLSLGTLCETMGYSYSWKAGEQPSLIKNERWVI